LNALVASLVLVAAVEGVPRFALQSWTVDGGGTRLARGGEVLMAGAAGQPDAGAADDGVGRFELQSGFFAEEAPPPGYAILIDGFEWGDTRRWSLQVPAGP
jgi:hypothetical protein